MSKILIKTVGSIPPELRLLGYRDFARWDYFIYYLGRRHKIVKVLNDFLPQPYRFYHAFRNFSPNISEWAKKYLTKNTWSFVKHSEICEDKIRKLRDEIDIVLQLGCLSSPYVSHAIRPYYLYIDSTAKMDQSENPNSQFRSVGERDQWIMLEKMVYRNAEKVFTMSEYTKGSLLVDYGIREAKVATVYAGANFYEIPDFDKYYDKNIILFVGKDFHRKGGFTVLRAFKEVKKHVKNATLFIVGCRPKIRDPNVTVKGAVLGRDELKRLYRAASVFVMPSLYEPFGFVFLEAMAHKLPCIGSTKNAMPEIIEDHQTGFLIPPSDHKALANRLIFLLRNNSVMKEMGEKGWRRVKEMFTWEEVVSRMTKDLEKSCARI